jgi:hypothetical protein
MYRRGMHLSGLIDIAVAGHRPHTPCARQQPAQPSRLCEGEDHQRTVARPPKAQAGKGLGVEEAASMRVVDAGQLAHPASNSFASCSHSSSSVPTAGVLSARLYQ